MWKDPPYGHPPGVRVGQTFEGRRAVYDAGIHLEMQKGIHGRSREERSRSSCRACTWMTRITATRSSTPEREDTTPTPGGRWRTRS
ncbi:MAG: YDG/SRA domain-containing protein [Myxococcales bacterium]|nr:YDG/SRA domain-containing protein [Myxococcales bacterium]